MPKKQKKPEESEQENDDEKKEKTNEKPQKKKEKSDKKKEKTEIESQSGMVFSLPKSKKKGKSPRQSETINENAEKKKEKRKDAKKSIVEAGLLVGAVDEGTTSARFIIFRAATDEIVCYHQIDVPSIFQQEGWCEQDPKIIINTVNDCIDGAVRKLLSLGGDPTKIVAIGVTNQRESTIVWDSKTGRAIANAIIWLDNRTASTVEDLLDTIPNGSRDINYLRPLCGLPLSTYFSAVKLRWLRDNDTNVKQAMLRGTARFGTVDSWVIYNLTGGEHKTDVTNASRTMLMNIETLEWDQRLLDFFGLPRSILPEICSSAEVYGQVASGPLHGVNITACMGDQQAALVGQQCLSKGLAKATFGTGCFLLYNAGTSIVHSHHGLLTTVGYQFGRKNHAFYALEGSISIAGAAINWLRDQAGLITGTGQVEPMANRVANTTDVYFVPAFNGLYAPYWNKEARGVICGINEETTSDHIVRATLESVCFQVRDVLDAMHKDCKIPLAKLSVDGGMTVNRLFMQLQSDICGIPVEPAKLSETTALGVALAALYVIRPTYDMSAPLSKTEMLRLIFKPRTTEKQRNERYTKWKMAVKRSLDWETPIRKERIDALSDILSDVDW